MKTEMKIVGSGIAYQLGTIDDEELYDSLAELKEEGELSISNKLDDEDGTDVYSSDYTNLFDLYSIDATDEKELTFYQNGNEVELKNCYWFQKSNPTISDFDISDDVVGVFGGVLFEYNTAITFEYESIEDGIFLILYLCTDEIAGDFSIVTDVLYVSQKELFEFLNTIGYEDFEIDELGELASDWSKLIDKFGIKFKIEMGELNGDEPILYSIDELE